MDEHSLVGYLGEDEETMEEEEVEEVVVDEGGWEGLKEEYV